MTFWTNTKVIGEVHQLFRRHWQKALRIREKVRFSEEAYHLILAGGVGVIGGLVNIFFYYANESVKRLFLRHPGDPMEVAEVLDSWQRVERVEVARSSRRVVTKSHQRKQAS